MRGCASVAVSVGEGNAAVGRSCRTVGSGGDVIAGGMVASAVGEGMAAGDGAAPQPVRSKTRVGRIKYGEWRIESWGELVITVLHHCCSTGATFLRSGADRPGLRKPPGWGTHPSRPAAD